MPRMASSVMVSESETHRKEFKSARRSDPYPRRWGAGSNAAWRCRRRRSAPPPPPVRPRGRADRGIRRRGRTAPGGRTARSTGRPHDRARCRRRRRAAGHRGRVPHGHALGGVLAVLVLPLVAAVRDVPLVGVEQAALRQEVGVAVGDLAHELVARLEDLGEPELLEAPGHVVDVRDGEVLVEVQVGLAQQRRVVARLPQGPGVGGAAGRDLLRSWCRRRGRARSAPS